MSSKSTARQPREKKVGHDSEEVIEPQISVPLPKGIMVVFVLTLWATLRVHVHARTRTHVCCCACRSTPSGPGVPRFVIRERPIDRDRDTVNDSCVVVDYIAE